MNTIAIAVVGAHLTGQPLNPQLTERGATLRQACRTAPVYQLYALLKTTPPKPGLKRVPPGQGTAIEVEVWDMPTEHFASFVSLIGSPLGIGTLLLEDQTEVKGFICEPFALDHALNISEFGGWRAYRASLDL
jgi:allophanate hydrolase